MNVPRVITMTLMVLLVVAPLSAEKVKKQKAKSLCSSEHNPVAVGASSEFRMTSRHLDTDKKVLDTTTNTYREEVTAVENDRYRTRTTTEGNTSESEWVCSDEGVALKFEEYPDTTVKSSGVTIPSKMEVGGVWNQSFESSSAGSSQQTKTVNRITGREKVVVPAGTFNAVRVDYEIETTVPDQPVSYVRGSQWFAPGVGLVKSASVVDLEMDEIRSIETTIELMKRSSPK